MGYIIMLYQSIPSHPPVQTPGEFFPKGKFPTPGHKERAKSRPLGQNRAKTPHSGQLFSKIEQKGTKHETEIMKNSTEMLISLEISLKQ